MAMHKNVILQTPIHCNLEKSFTSEANNKIFDRVNTAVYKPEN